MSSAIHSAGHTVFASTMRDRMLEGGAEDEKKATSHELERLLLTLT